MMGILNVSDLKAIKAKLLCIYALNVTDLLFTWFLLKTGCFVEANVFMQGIISSSFFSILCKVVLPLFLLGLLSFRLNKATFKQLVKANFLINICMIGYFTLNISHIIWTGMYIFA